MQIQGICAYYYKEKHPEIAVELNRCNINSMADNPRFGPNEKQKPGQCRDGRMTCEDCRHSNVSTILSSHFTLCQKPWTCPSFWDVESDKICSQLHSEWFRIRRNYEESRKDDLRQIPDLTGNYMPEIYYGYCNKPGQSGYLPVNI